MTAPVAALLAFACLAVAGAHFPRPPLVKPIYDLSDAHNIYKIFVAQHSKVYGAEEYQKRFEIFKETLRKVNELNHKYEGTSFTIYHFADLTKEEINKYKGFKPSNSSSRVTVRAIPPAWPSEPPAAFDWRDHGAVSPVKNQGPCSSCYIFSAIGNIEGQYAIKHKQCVALSEQQCMDCIHSNACDGGVMADVMNLLPKDDAACMKAADYPYHAAKGTCKEDKTKKVATVTSGTQMAIVDEDALLKMLYNYGPLAVAMDASDLDTYRGGILSPVLCRGDLDHGLTLVGYGEESGKKFWIIKNSWGEAWGEKGYLRLERGVDACKMGTGYTAAAQVA